MVKWFVLFRILEKLGKIERWEINDDVDSNLFKLYFNFNKKEKKRNSSDYSKRKWSRIIWIFRRLFFIASRVKKKKGEKRKKIRETVKIKFFKGKSRKAWWEKRWKRHSIRILMKQMQTRGGEEETWCCKFTSFSFAVRPSVILKV